MDEIFFLRDGQNFVISKFSRSRSLRLEFERQDEMMVKSQGEMY